MDLRYFEIHDLLCEALIALEAGDQARAATCVHKAVVWVEADWLATPFSVPTPTGPPVATPDVDDEDD